MYEPMRVELIRVGMREVMRVEDLDGATFYIPIATLPSCRHDIVEAPATFDSCESRCADCGEPLSQAEARAILERGSHGNTPQ